MRSPAATASPSRDEADDAAGDEAGDLHHADARARRLDHEGVALVVLARLVELGVEEQAGGVDLLDDAAGHRRAVHVAVEHVHEHRDARHRLGGKPESRPAAPR